MNTISVKKMGLAFGAVGILYYLGCISIMTIFGREGTVVLFNMLFHGLDSESIVRMNVPLWESVTGVLVIFLLAAFSGAIIALIYNTGASNKNKKVKF